MFRKDLIPLLQDNPLGLDEIAHQMAMTQKDVEDDLKHLMKSLKHSDYQLCIIPAKCRKCGFIFNKEKLRKPGKCPKCHNTWIQEPVFLINLRS